MALLPARNILDGSASPLTSAWKTAIGQVWDFLNAMLSAGSAAAPAVAVGGQDNGLFLASGGVGISAGGVRRAVFAPGWNTIGEGSSSPSTFLYLRGESVSTSTVGVGFSNLITFRTDGTKQTTAYATQNQIILADDGSPRTFANVHGTRCLAPDTSGLSVGSVVTQFFGYTQDSVSDPKILTAVAYQSSMPAIPGLDRWGARFTGTAPNYFAGDTTLAANQINKQAAPAAVNTTATLSTSAVTSRLITTTPTAAATLTLPDGTSLDTALPSMSTSQSVDWSVINLSGTFVSTLAAATGHTVVGNMAIPVSMSATFRTRKTGTATYITYRIS